MQYDTPGGSGLLTVTLVFTIRSTKGGGASACHMQAGRGGQKVHQPLKLVLLCKGGVVNIKKDCCRSNLLGALGRRF